MLRPVDARYPVTSAFAEWPPWRQHLGLLAHAGVDFATPAGSVVSAPMAGTVRTYQTEWGGQHLSIDGVFTSPGPVVDDKMHFWIEFAHLSRLVALPNPRVNIGDDVAYTGSSGSQAIGPHLHAVMAVLTSTRGWLLVDPALYWPEVPTGEHAYLTRGTRRPIYR